eukprot:CAMPEP_0185172808 /NCGR_PEP_ID=MMETSP1139-20130426/22177_1 /TAXON_ID=298111 /ORGANISM="Pavlova sp., Strain CCMP459" /LENGTH=109 /DNA_ID=CAMNT_0027738465 /DNA_START=29 /DNA_END=358 /DNA_ORIENTATION=-
MAFVVIVIAPCRASQKHEARHSLQGSLRDAWTQEKHQSECRSTDGDTGPDLASREPGMHSRCKLPCAQARTHDAFHCHTSMEIRQPESPSLRREVKCVPASWVLPDHHY